MSAYYQTINGNKNYMKIYPLQSFGIGDIIFCQSLAAHWRGEGYHVVWGTEPQFVEGLTRAYHDVTFLDKRVLNIDYNIKDKRPYLDGVIAPIRWADQILRLPYTDCMRAKYMLYDLDYNIWRRNAMPFRDIDKERKLAELLGATGEYNLVSSHFGSDSRFNANISVDNGLPNIEMRTMKGYSLFDWCYIIENATNIHTVSSSIVYLLEILKLQAKEVHLYGRSIEPKTWYQNIEYLLSKKYIIHG